MLRREIIDLPSAWNAGQLARHPDWIYRLRASELAEIQTALETCEADDYRAVTADNFPLPRFGKTIHDRFLVQLERGIGTLLIKGIDAANHSLLELERLFFGIGAHFGTPVSQGRRGESLRHIKARPDPKIRGIDTRFKLPFHTDAADVTGLFCVNQARAGGISRMTSSVAVHNEMQRRCPEVLNQLYQPYYHVPHNRKDRYFTRPIFAIERGHFVFSIVRRFIVMAQNLPAVPEMDAAQLNALNVLEELAGDNALCHEFYLEPGDMWWVNNYTVVHSRDQFSDGADGENRLLLRLWLAVANSRPLPQSFLPDYGDVSAGAVRGGILPLDSGPGL